MFDPYDYDKDKLPPWSDVEAIIDLFREVDPGEWLWNVPDFPTPLQEAIQKAEKGDRADLIRMAGPKKRGQRGPQPKEERFWMNEIHPATFIVPFIEDDLRMLYREPSDKEIRDVAIWTAEALTGVDGERIRRQLARHDRQRLV